MNCTRSRARITEATFRPPGSALTFSSALTGNRFRRLGHATKEGVNVRVSRETLSTPHLAGRDPHPSRDPINAEGSADLTGRVLHASSPSVDCPSSSGRSARPPLGQVVVSFGVNERDAFHVKHRLHAGLRTRRFASSLRRRDDTSLRATAADRRRVPAARHSSTRDSSGRAEPVCDPQNVSRHGEGTTDRSSPRARHPERRGLRLRRFNSSSRP